MPSGSFKTTKEQVKEIPPGHYIFYGDIRDKSKAANKDSYCDDLGKSGCWSQSIVRDKSFIQPDINMFGLVIHPDGKSDGTDGCVGATPTDGKPNLEDLLEAIKNDPDRTLEVK